jgi:hypothetical protein
MVQSAAVEMNAGRILIAADLAIPFSAAGLAPLPTAT